jgi:hypothetical protein
LSNEKISNKTLYTLSIFLEIAKTTLLLSASNIQMVGKSLYESVSFRPGKSQNFVKGMYQTPIFRNHIWYPSIFINKSYLQFRPMLPKHAWFLPHSQINVHLVKITVEVLMYGILIQLWRHSRPHSTVFLKSRVKWCCK